MHFTCTTMLLLVFSATAGSQEWMRSMAPVEVPANLVAGVYRPTVEAMWKASPTFRHQCERLAARPALTVKLVVDLSRVPNPAIRASAEISRKNGILVFARVMIHSPDDTVELIAHEIEHVIEQIEGLRSPTLESTRAIEVGRRVAREFEHSRRVMHAFADSRIRD